MNDKDILNEFERIDGLLSNSLKDICGEMPDMNIKNILYSEILSQHNITNQDVKSLFESLKRDEKINKILKD